MKTNYLIGAFCILFFFACTKTTKKTDEATPLKVYVLDGGYFDFRILRIFSLDSVYEGKRMSLDNPVFLIEHEKGRLIWDLGLPDQYADRDPEKLDTTGMFSSYIREKLIDQFKKMEITPDSIDYVAVSHTHFDHIGNGNYFKNSTWVVDENEYNWAFREKANTENYDSLRDSKRIFFKESYDVFKDSTVVIYSLPGHTPGHTCLSIKLKDENLLLSGDLYHFIEQREFKRVPTFNTDVDMTLQSMEQFEKLVKQLNAKVVIQHERTHFEKLPKYPKYLE
jgi:glyoxylase-like metal-dependent hydrolase (beta-lactamase superfamily II)